MARDFADKEMAPHMLEVRRDSKGKKEGGGGEREVNSQIIIIDAQSILSILVG